MRLIFLVLAAACGSVMAGPPFQTDDPEPVDFQHYEAYLFGAFDRTAIGTYNLGPAFEFNWGAVPDVQIHLIVPLAFYAPAVGPAAFGIGDTEIGVKYRFVHETKHRPEIGTFPFIEVPTGNYTTGLGNGRTWYRAPIWAQKTIGEWTTYGGAGAVFNKQTGFRNYSFAGWLVQRNIGKKWTLGAEAFAHGAEGAAALSTRASALVDFGGYYYIRNPGFQVLFMVGHSVAGQRESTGYLGLYWTWGSDAKKQSGRLRFPHDG